jgi:hypothetical protein
MRATANEDTDGRYVSSVCLSFNADMGRCRTYTAVFRFNDACGSPQRTIQRTVFVPQNGSSFDTSTCLSTEPSSVLTDFLLCDSVC